MKSNIKKTILSILLIGLQSIYAQVPQKMSFQAVVKNASNEPVVSGIVGVKISILQESTSGTTVYSETQNATTNANGLVSLIIGNGTVISGVFSSINWATNTYFLQTEIDPTGGTNYAISNTTQLLSVPYALHAKTAESVNETDPKVNTSITNKVPKWNGSHLVDGSVYDDGTNVGIGIVPTHKFQVAMGYQTTSTRIINQEVGGVQNSSTEPKYQSFLANATGQINTIALMIGYTPSPENRQIQLFEGEGINGNLLATSSLVEIPITPNGFIQWVNFPITGVELEYGKMYTFQIDNGNRVVYSVINPYPSGSFNGVAANDLRFRISVNLPNSGFVVNNNGVSINNYTLPSSDGAPNSILKTDGAGSLSWTDTLPFTENDPQISSATVTKIPKWNGTTLVDGIIQDNGVGIGVNTAPVAGNDLTINGKTVTSNFQMTNGATNGYILQSNAVGNATWVNPTSLISENDPQVTATTINYIPKWNGTSLIDGSIFDNGTYVGIGTTTPNADLTIGTPFSFSGIDRKLSINTSNNQPIVVGETTNNKAIMFGYDGNNIQGRSGVDFSLNSNLILNNYGGNVGIGTTNPTDKLEVAGKTKTTSLQTTNFQMTNGAAAGYILQSSPLGNASWVNPMALGINETDPKVASTTINKLSKWDGTNLIDSQIIDNGTSIGIGTSTPTQAKFVVSGNENSIVANYGFLKADGSTGTNNSGTAQNYSIYASNRIAASEFNAFSDARIKNIKGITNNKQDLETLNKIEITNYTLKDTITKGTNNYKKVIAQQIEKVYPQAVSKITDVIPDIYKYAEMTNGYVTLKNNLKTGEKIKIITKSGTEIVEILDANSNGFKTNSNKTENIFVYGKQVSDFRSVDYEALSTLNISATQELLKRIEQLEKENATLKTQAAKVDNLETALNQEKTNNQKMQQDISEIKEMLHQLPLTNDISKNN